MPDSILFQAIIYLFAAVICVPIAKRLGLGSVLGYLIAGIVIGPFLLGFVGEEGKDLMHFAEFGVVMMLFLIGLELEPAKLWKIRKQILGVGLTQVLFTTIVIFLTGILLGFQWQSSLAVSLALSMSSTAIVLQSLKEKRLMQTAAGQNSFAVLLFQDIAVIPILAILPLLAVQHTTTIAHGHESFFDQLPGWLQTIAVLSAVAAIIIIGRYGIVPLLRIVAKTRLRELFTASALLIVISIAFLMQTVGLSPALGTFLAGVILANSEFKHELESDLEPFKGLLLGLFFMAVGASINFSLIIAQPILIISLTLIVIAIKALLLLGIGKFFSISLPQNLIFAIGLSQVGEFAFVLFSFMNQLSILPSEYIDTMIAVTALSMTITPILILLNEKVLLPRMKQLPVTEQQADTIDEKHSVIIVGFSHFGSTIGRFLRANGVEATILDNDTDRVDFLRKMGFKVYYGDATREDLLEAAGASEAKILITAIDSPEVNMTLVETVKKHFPHLELLVRAKNRSDAYELIDLEVHHIYREHLDTSIRLGMDVLKKLGYRSYSVTRAGQNFLKYDEAALWQLGKHRKDMKTYINSVRETIEQQEQLLQSDVQHNPTINDNAWDSEYMRERIAKG
jgi:CPA2 family monovalent cation:H+ antiporter-2